MTMDAHYPDGLLAGAHPGLAADCPALVCVRRRREDAATPDLRQRITDTIDRLHETGAVYAIEDHECDRIADALLPLIDGERAAELREAADVADCDDGTITAGELRRMAHRVAPAAEEQPHT